MYTSQVVNYILCKRYLTRQFENVFPWSNLSVNAKEIFEMEEIFLATLLDTLSLVPIRKSSYKIISSNKTEIRKSRTYSGSQGVPTEEPPRATYSRNANFRVSLKTYPAFTRSTSL